MSKYVEIEFKTMLTKEEYLRLTAAYEFTETDMHTQTNIYFDTPDHQLKKQHAALRIRLLETEAELTLKTPLPEGLLETTETLTLSKANALIQRKEIPKAGAVAKKICSLGVNPSDLILLTSLKTKRGERKIPAGLLALDENWYADQHDFELELEVSDYHKGLHDFSQLLEKNQLELRPAKNKILRALSAIDKGQD